SSSLDRQAEQELRKTLIEIGKDRTVIMITHSPILLAACDDLVALDRGKVALAGPSKEILPKLFGQSAKPQAPPAAPTPAPASKPPAPKAVAAKPAAPIPAPQAVKAPPHPPGAVNTPPIPATAVPAAPAIPPRPSTADPSVPGGNMFRLKNNAGSATAAPAAAAPATPMTPPPPSPSDDPYADLIDAARGPTMEQLARPK
ncbi:MAG: hypothetical protein HQ494_02600, partial [Rhodospirillales bacterium]|nr:hypothetical protein [Rhodospirillales bacterium]